MKKVSANPFNFCPICGVHWGRHGYGCKKAALAAIDAANTRAAMSDDIASDETWYPEPRDFSSRLREGFQMLDGEDRGE